ncbi:MAG: hypothetical protein AB7F29_18420 [Candidatus Nitrosocosmicus sp.]
MDSTRSQKKVMKFSHSFCLKYPRKETCLLPRDSLLAGLVKVHGKHAPVSTDGERMWYHQACRFSKLKHLIIFFGKLEKSLIEKAMKYFKDRTEIFDVCFQSQKGNCRINPVINWLNLFVCKYNKDIRA